MAYNSYHDLMRFQAEENSRKDKLIEELREQLARKDATIAYYKEEVKRLEFRSKALETAVNKLKDFPV